MEKLRVLDLFSGIGGFSLGLERAGMRTVAFCEIEEFPRKVLRKHWPEVPIYDDVRTLTAARLAADGIGVDVICGGFPCQDISNAGKRAGIKGERSGLWSEYARIIGELQPQYIIVENVAALLGRGLSRVLGDLAEVGYDAEWHCISAVDVDAPHRRERIWIIAYPYGKREQCVLDDGSIKRSEAFASFWHVDIGKCGCGTPTSFNKTIPYDWLVGAVNGIREPMAKYRALGNAVVPQIPELIGKAIIKSMETI